MGQRQMGDQAGNRTGLRAVALHEFQPRRRIEKEIAHDHAGPLGAAGLAHRAGHAALQMQHRTGRRILCAAENVQPGDGGDGGQRLAAEAQRADGGKVFRCAQLAGGVAQKRGGQLVRRDAAAVVADAKIRHAAVLDLHGHGGGAGVDRVFQKLLDHAGRTLHHFTGGDQVRNMRGKLLNMRHETASLTKE